LCLKYDERARIAEYQFFRSDEADKAERQGIDVETAALGAKLRGGGDLFHRSCAILSFACVGSKRCRGHALDQLKLQGAGISGELCFLSGFHALNFPYFT
jgi:beta-catenin-like protein 1